MLKKKELILISCLLLLLKLFILFEENNLSVQEKFVFNNLEIGRLSLIFSKLSEYIRFSSESVLFKIFLCSIFFLLKELFILKNLLEKVLFA